MDMLFDWVYRGLFWLSEVSGYTYREINILLYYFISPFVFVYLFERITKTHYIKVTYSVLAISALIFITDFEQYSDRAFEASVVFLKGFDVIGLNYMQASVVVCVILPILIGLVLLYFGQKKAPLK